MKEQPNQAQKTTDRVIEFSFYDKKGVVDGHKMFRTSFYILVTGFTLSFHLSLFVYLYFKKNFIPHSLLDYIDVMENTYKWAMYNIQVQWLFEFIAIITISTLTPLYPIYKLIQHIRYKSHIQSVLSSIGASQYYLYKRDDEKREYTFKLIKGEKTDFKVFIDRADDLKQHFNVGDLDASRHEKDKVILTFKEKMPTIDTAPDMDYSIHTGKKRLFLGISDTKGTPVYATSKEQGNGLLNGHWLVVGGSGSGKSFSIKQFLLNFLQEDNYRYIDKIYIINYKASADYNFLRRLDKVEYADGIAEGLRILKKVQLNMLTKYRYNSVHNKDNYLQTQTLLIIDEIQTLPETLESKSIHKIMKNTIQESLAILEMLGSKARASNISLINILQKADVHSLPSTAYRSNLRNRFMLKQENISSAHLVINNDITDRNAVNPLELAQGQYIYWDMLTNTLQRGFTVLNGIEFDKDELNNLAFDDETQAILDEIEGYKGLAIESINNQQEMMNRLEEAGQKTFCDNFNDIVDEPEVTPEHTEDEENIQELPLLDKESLKAKMKEHKNDTKNKPEEEPDDIMKLFSDLDKKPDMK